MRASIFSSPQYGILLLEIWNPLLVGRKEA